MHRHVWKHFNKDIPYLCSVGDCKAELTQEEAERRLNAVECLGAEFAIEIAMGIEESGLGRVTSDAPALRAYALALEGQPEGGG